MTKTFLECYNEWMKTGMLPKGGLCESLPQKLEKSETWKLMRPTRMDLDEVFNNNCSDIFWGYEVPYDDVNHTYKDRYFAFTPLRQTLILLAAAINGELD